MKKNIIKKQKIATVEMWIAIAAMALLFVIQAAKYIEQNF
jgi:hypothetical protein